VNAPANLTDAAFRAAHVGASEVAALFDASPWLTHFELYHRKVGTIATPDFNAVRDDGTPENERIHWGVILEDAIVAEACRRWGYVEREPVRHLSNGKGLGGHPDRRVICPERGPGVLEAKMVDWLEVKKWGDEPPVHYLLQNQSYQGLDGVTWGDMIVLVGGNELRRFQYDFRPGLFAEIERRVGDFWDRVRANNAPPVDYSRDGASLIEAIGAPDDSLADLRDCLEAEQEAMDWLDARARRDAAITDMDIAKARLIERIGAAGTALLPSFRIGCGETKGSPDKEVTADMIGTVIKGRRGYRRFDVKEIK